MNGYYIVAELPKELWEPIIECRKQIEPWRARLPVEITLLGSGGTGPITADTSLDEIIKELTKTLGDTTQLQCKLNDIKTFPDTGLYYFSLENTGLFERIHEKLKNMNLNFHASPFPFTPHCTICDISQYKGVKTDVINYITSLSIPYHTLNLQKISIYEFDDSTYRANKFTEITLDK